MQVSNMSNQYIFDSPSSSRVQVGRLDTTTSKEQDTTTEETEKNTTKESTTSTESKEIQQVINEDNRLDLYA